MKELNGTFGNKNNRLKFFNVKKCICILRGYILKTDVFILYNNDKYYENKGFYVIYANVHYEDLY